MPQAEYELLPAATVESVPQRPLVARHQREQCEQVCRLPAAVHVTFRERNVAADDDVAAHCPVAQTKLGATGEPPNRAARAEATRDPIRCGEGKRAAMEALEQRHDQATGGGSCGIAGSRRERSAERAHRVVRRSGGAGLAT